MTVQSVPIAKGLEGIIVAQTRKSKVDGTGGRLIYNGYDIVDLAAKATFEEVIYLLWHDKLPTQAELDDLRSDLAANSDLPPQLVDLMRVFPKDSHPMNVLRTFVSAVGTFDPESEDTSPKGNIKKALRLTAVMPTVVAAWDRLRNGQEPVASRKNLSIAANFLYMLKGTEPEQIAVEAINTYLVLLADHGMNASTFSARVTTSTQSDLYSAITTAIGTLKGPAHGGAGEKAMEQFIEVGSPDNTEAWFDQAMSSGRRIMGIGHRVYKTDDPRAKILREWARKLGEQRGDTRYFEIASRLEQKARAHPHFIERDLHANVDYYSALVLYEVGIPIDLFTPLFAISRIAGWTANVIEQWSDNRLIRPQVQYVGPENLAWVPIERRS